MSWNARRGMHATLLLAAMSIVFFGEASADEASGADAASTSASSSASAAPAYAVGDRLERIRLDDQHGEPVSIDDATRVLLFSRDMDGGALLKAALEDVEPDALEDIGVVYVSDISGMPKLVARLFAVPSMRRRPYRMALDRSGEQTARLPDVEGQATLVHLDRLRVTQIEHLTSADAVREALGLPDLDDCAH